MNISQKPYEDRPKRGGNLDRNSLSLCIFAVDNKTIEMSLLRVMNMFLLVVAVVLTGCEDGVVPENLRIPELPVVSAVAEGRVVTLTATFKSVVELSSAKEFGFYFGEDEQSMERMTAAKTDGLGYSLILEDLEYSTTYSYKAWVGNGRDEVSSDSREVVTGKEPVGPDPPSPVEQNIEFKDPEVKALCVENWDLDGDGELSKAEAAKVTNLRWVFKRNEEITSFEEFEYFTGLTSVADSAFKLCRNLVNIKLPESVSVIGERAFEECGNMLLSKLPDNLTIVKTHAFVGCSSMPLTSLPETITEIGSWAFSRCSNIRLSALPSILTMIEGGVFAHCPGVAPSELPANIHYIGDWAFINCVNFNPKNIPSGVKEIGKYAFQGCESLAWTSLPDGLLEIGSHAFWFCYELKLTELPPQIYCLHESVFENCWSMETLALPENLDKIESRAFANCRFFEITIPGNVYYIGPLAFSGCEYLRQVTVLPSTPPDMEDTFLGDNANVIFVPSASIEKYKTANNWSEWTAKYKTLTDRDSGKNPGSGSGDDSGDERGNDPITYVDGGVDYGDGIVIDGTVWAPVNCGYHPENYPFGKVYQWGRKFGFGYSDPNYKDASSPVLKSGPVSADVGLSEANSNVFFTSYRGSWLSVKNSTLWNKGTDANPIKTENDPCPDGWRLPTLSECTSLKLHYSSLVTYAGQKGRWFSGNKTYGSGVPAIFLPLAGYIDNSGNAKHRQVGDTYGHPEGLYWSSSACDSYDYYSARGLRLTPTYVDIVYGQADAYTIRCVAERHDSSMNK